MGNQFNGYGDTIYLKGDIVRMIQTGIRFINAENELVVAKIPEKKADNIDFSLIEFCGSSMSDEDRFKEYELISIETNYEDSTRGKLFNKKGNEVKDEEDT